MKTNIKVLHWLPRITCIIAILFISLFALDSFGPNMTFWQQIGAFLIHLIPTYILIALLLVAWKWEYIGGIIFIIIALIMSLIIFKLNFNMNQSVGLSFRIIMMITFPFIIIGTLFILSHFIKKRNLQKKNN